VAVAQLAATAQEQTVVLAEQATTLQHSGARAQARHATQVEAVAAGTRVRVAVAVVAAQGLRHHRQEVVLMERQAQRTQAAVAVAASLLEMAIPPLVLSAATVALASC
jgi:mannose-1-phosphate guanylyltransferase